jgi:hypothetical protein
VRTRAGFVSAPFSAELKRPGKRYCIAKVERRYTAAKVRAKRAADARDLFLAMIESGE